MPGLNLDDEGASMSILDRLSIISACSCIRSSFSAIAARVKILRCCNAGLVFIRLTLSLVLAALVSTSAAAGLLKEILRFLLLISLANGRGEGGGVRYCCEALSW